MEHTSTPKMPGKEAVDHTETANRQSRIPTARDKQRDCVQLRHRASMYVACLSSVFLHASENWTVRGAT